MATIERPETAGVRSRREVSSAPAMTIDTDVHEGIGSLAELAPYLDPAWRRYYERHCSHFRTASPTEMPYAHPMPNGSQGRGDWIVEGGPRPGYSLELLREQLFMGEGVSIGILDGSGTWATSKGNFELATALVAAYNDWQIDHWLDPEPRLRGSVHVHPNDPEVAAREIDRVAAHPQIVQVFLPNTTNRQYGDPFYRPIFEAALRNDLVVTFHHRDTQTALGWPRYYIDWHTVAAPHAAQCQLLGLICNGLFDKYPELRVVFLETGVGWVPWFMARADQQYRELRVEVPWVKRLPSDHMRDNVRLATQPMNDTKPEEFVALVEATESERIFVFATDYPHYDADSAHVILPETVPAELRNRVYYQNALETYPRLSTIDPKALGKAHGASD